MIRILAVCIFLIPSLFSAERRTTVVCVHGFMGASWNMYPIKKKLAKDKWNAVSWNYPSRDYFIEEHGEELVHYLMDLAAENPDHPIYFVAHSMGSLVLLSALNHPLCPHEAKIGKVVLLAPPIQGSLFARWANRFPIARRIAKGFAGHELMTQSQFGYLGNYPSSLESVLVIAGNFGFNPILEGENDGTLGVSETVLPTPHQHVVIKKGGNSISLTDFRLVETLPNVGCEGHTYLKHIIDNYDRLADVTFFFQGCIHDHIPEGQSPKKMYFDALDRVVAFLQKIKSHNRWDFARTWIGKGTNSKNLSLSQYDFGGYWECVFGTKHPEKIPVSYRGCFAATREKIHTRPKQFYARILNTMDKNMNPEEGHYLERLWASIFGL